MRKAGFLIAMWLLGIASFALLGWVVQVRIGQPVSGGGADADDGSGPVRILLNGLAGSIRVADEGIGRGEGGGAVHALDGAMRAARVGYAATEPVARWALADAVEQIEEARLDLQIGLRADARHHLGEALSAVRGVDAMEILETPSVPASSLWDGYRGATLLNANGVRIGELKDLRTAGGREEAVIRLGRIQDLFGFLDLAGTEATVPAEDLLFGEPRGVGVVNVVLPTPESVPARILASLLG